MLNSDCLYRKQIEEKGFFICTPIGISMMPLLRQRIDTVKLTKITRPLKRGDVVLYQRPTGKYVLHRIVKVKGDKYHICGDNQVTLERNVPDSWMIAVMEGFYREDDYIDIENEKYLEYSKKIMSSRIRRLIKHKFKRLFEILFKKTK